MNQCLHIRYALLQVQLLLQVSVSEILTDFLSQKFCWRDFWSSSLTYLRCFVVNWMNLRQSASEKRECAFHRNPPNSLAQKGVSSASYPWFSWKTSVVIGSNIYNIYNIKWQSPDISKVWCVKVIRKQKLEEISHHCCSSEGRGLHRSPQQERWHWEGSQSLKEKKSYIWVCSRYDISPWKAN